jgi:RNA-directed DNA polymerase
MIQAWLKAGVFEAGKGFAPTEEGTPQGGVISPLLLNVALHGMEHAAGGRDQAHQVKAALAQWLAPRGLAFNEDKTCVLSVDEGFDFLGFNVRRYSGKLLITPSAAAVQRLRRRLRAEMAAARGANASAVLRAINPIVRGWTAYYRTVVSSATFNRLDAYLWRLAHKWAVHSHQNKPKGWIIPRYFGRFNPARNDQWVFGDRDSGAYLRKFSWTRIVRHQLVKGTSSPDDPTLEHYWAKRRRKGPPPPMDGADLRLLKAQHGRCPLCGGFLLAADHEPQHPREWEQWIAVTRKAMSKHHIVEHGPSTDSDLVHAHCQRRHTTNRDSPQLPRAREPSGLA